MLLSLFRLTMIIPLLVSAVCIEANSKKLPFAPSEKDKALVEIPNESNAFAKDDAGPVDDLDQESPLRKRQSNRNNGYSDGRDPRIRSVGSIENRVVRSSDGNLAQKLAKDALKSPKMQQAMNKLTHGAPRKNLYASVKLPARGTAKLTHDGKMHGKPVRRKGQKKKRKRHHRRYRNQHAGGLKRGSSKRPSNTKGDINAPAKKLHGNENSIIKRHQAATDYKSRHRPSVSKSSDKITAVKVEDSDYDDFSSPLTTGSFVRSTKSHKNSGSAKLHGGENMVERLMRTTTRDPSKKSPGDQGIEYSDYYSEDDVLQDIAANKIPMGVAETRNPNDRFTRQTVNSTSYYNDNQIDRNVQPYYQDYDAGGKDCRYTYHTRDNFQNYPALKHSALNRDSRFHEADDAPIGYPPNYNPLDDQNENFDVAYPVNADEIAGQPQIPERYPDVSDVQNSLDVPDLNNVNNDVQPQDPDQFGYLNPYDVPQDEYSRSFDANGAQNLNLNDGREPELEDLRFSQNKDPIAELPLFSNKYSVPEAQNLYSYRRAGTNMHHLGNFEQSVINRPRLGSFRPSRVKEEDVDSNPQSDLRDQSLDGFPAQLKGNYHDNPNDSPSGNVPNAMDVPLGKVLESLGISISTEPSNSNQNSNSKELSVASSVMERHNNLVPVSESLDWPSEHVLSPSYIRKPSKEDLNKVYEGRNVEGQDHQALKPRNENSNVRDGHARRQSIQNGLSNDNLFTNEGKNDGHHMNISIAVHDTKQVASQILDTIMDELEELKFDPAKNNKREGSWSTAQAGMKLDMKVVNHSIVVTVSDLATPRFHETLLNGTWNVSGHVPFKRGAPFTLTATDSHTNSIAVFVGTLSVLYMGLHPRGACRVCQGIDTIAGVWSVARKPKDCRDFQVATSVFNDIFRKTKLSSLKEKQNAASTADSTTAKKEKKRS